MESHSKTQYIIINVILGLAVRKIFNLISIFMLSINHTFGVKRVFYAK